MAVNPFTDFGPSPVEDLDAQIAEADSALAQASATSGIVRFGPGGALVLVGIAWGFVGPHLGQYLSGSALLVAFIAAGIGVFAVVGTEGRRQALIAGAKSHLDSLKQRKKIQERFAGTGSGTAGTGTDGDASYFDSLVRINVDNLAAYYSLVKLHTNKSFNVAVAVGVIGFGLIAVGLGFGFATNRNSETLTFISSGAGVITEFISGVFFYLYNRTVRQMKGYHDSLLAVQNILLSFKLVGDTKDEKEKVRMVSEMLAYLIGKKTAEGSDADADDTPPKSTAKGAGV